MVDVTRHKIFPTIINEFQFSMDKQEYDLVIDEKGNHPIVRKDLFWEQYGEPLNTNDGMDTLYYYFNNALINHITKN